MINKYAFSNLIYTIKNYSEGLDKFEAGLGVQLNDNFMVLIFDELLDTITDSFFTQEEIEENICDMNGNHFAYDCDPVFKHSWENINELLYHFCFTGIFGKNQKVLINILTITDNETNEVLEKYNIRDTNELYDVIVRFLSRIEDENTNVTYYINCSKKD